MAGGQMTKKKKLFVKLIIVIALLFLWLLIRGPEDSWICVGGEWVKHGVPDAPKPEGGCSQLDNLNPFR